MIFIFGARRIVRALDDRFEYAARAGDPVPITESQLDLAFYTFGYDGV